MAPRASSPTDCDSDSDIYDYWDFYYDLGNHSNDPTDELVSDHMDQVLGVDSMHRAYHLYEAGSPAGEYGTTVERLGLRSLSRQEGLWPLSGQASTGSTPRAISMRWTPSTSTMSPR